VIGVVDLRWGGAVGPGQPSGVGDLCLVVALDDQGVIGVQAKNNLSGTPSARPLERSPAASSATFSALPDSESFTAGPLPLC
jgi:hypothetical protein